MADFCPSSRAKLPVNESWYEPGVRTARSRSETLRLQTFYRTGETRQRNDPQLPQPRFGRAAAGADVIRVSVGPVAACVGGCMRSTRSLTTKLTVIIISQ